MVKFKVTFTVDTAGFVKIVPELRFVDDLQIEEIVPAPDPKWRPDPTALPSDWKLNPPKSKYQAKRPKRKNRGPDLDRGLNKIILSVLADGGIHKATECQTAIRNESSYSPNSVGSRLEALRSFGIVQRMPNNSWKLVKQLITNEMHKVVKDYHNGDEGE